MSNLEQEQYVVVVMPDAASHWSTGRLTGIDLILGPFGEAEAQRVMVEQASLIPPTDSWEQISPHGLSDGGPGTIEIVKLGEHWQDMTIRSTVEHDCQDNAVPYVSDGALGHGWECGICGRFLQAG